ncbi:MAG: hypothetical protein Q9M13_01650, partial [Mariprofundales bacterium]|nr:hypothetical protein [Mariprofundales bacterium]
MRADLQTLIRQLLVGLVLLACTILAWVTWHPVSTHQESRSITIQIAPPPEQVSQRWQVVSRRMIRREDAQQIREQMVAIGLQPQLISSYEQLQWHEFTDPYSYHSIADTLEAQARWQQHGVTSTILRDDTGNHLLLGRFLSSAEADGERQRLIASALPWQERREREEAVVWRLYFTPQTRKEAEVTWRLTQQHGGLDPILKRYDKPPATSTEGAVNSSGR